MAIADPELDVAVEAMVAEDARFVVVGGFSVIANGFVGAAEGIDFLGPDDDAENDRRILAALRRLGGVRLRDICRRHLGAASATAPCAEELFGK